MADTMSSDFWIKPEADGRRFAAALGIGLLLELGALGLLLPAMSHQETPATTPSPVKLSIIAPAPAPKPPPPTPAPPKPVPPKPVTPPPPPVPTPPPLPMAPPMPPPPPRPAEHHITRHFVAARPKYTPPPTPQPPQPQQPVAQTPPPPPVPPAPTGGEVDAFSAAIKRALQAHANQVYPQAAQAGPRDRRARTHLHLSQRRGDRDLANALLRLSAARLRSVGGCAHRRLSAAAARVRRAAPTTSP